MFKLQQSLSIVLVLAALVNARADEPVSEFVQRSWVSQPHITSPTGLSVSPQGVVFVSCDPNGTTNERQGVGKVVRCEDTNGDGTADRFSDYVSGLDSPRGSCYAGSTLYLVQPPMLAAYQDANGDGVAEKRTVLVRNLGLPLHAAAAHHGANGVCMGIDGWLYLAVGDQGCFEATGTDGSQATLYGGGVLRVRPDGSQISVLVRGTRNIYDIAVDPYLNLFARDNTNDGGGWNTRLHHLTELAHFGYPNLYRSFSHEHMPPLADYGPGAGTAMVYLHEPGFPEDFGEALYSGDFNNGVAIHRRKSHEATFLIQEESFMDVSKNTGIAVDGFSRIYAASWLGGGFGSAREPFGRVDVIQTKDRTDAAIYPNIKEATDTELLTHLASRSQVARLNAMLELARRGSRPLFSEGLLAMAKDSSAPLYVRVAAVMTLKQLDGAKSHLVLINLYQDSDVREVVVRALGDVASEIDDSCKKMFHQALKDENPRVQMRAVIALARSGDSTAAPALLSLARDEKMTLVPSKELDSNPNTDDWSTPHRAVPHTALKALVSLNAVDLLLRKLDDAELRETALRALQEMHRENVVSGLAEKVEATRDTELVRLIALALFRLYHREAAWDGRTWWGTRPNFAGPYVYGATWEGTPAVRAALEVAFRKADREDYAYLFTQMRLNQVPKDDLHLEIDFDEVLSFLEREALTPEEYNQVMDAAASDSRPEEELLKIYEYFGRASFPESYLDRVHVLRLWGEGRAEGKLQRQAYDDFVSGNEFVGKVKLLEPFFKNSEKDSYKYAHLQLLHLINDPDVPQATRDAAAAEMEKTWADQKKLYAHRLRGLMLAFEEFDPSPYAEQLKPLVDHRDERVKQPAIRFLQVINGDRASPN